MASRTLLAVCAVLMAVAVANAASGEPVSVVVGLAKCADCTRKNMKAESAFKGLQVAIKCKNKNGEYESKAIGKLDGSGAFSVPLTADLNGVDCHAQLHSASGKPCPGQEPSTIVPQSEGTFIAVPGKMHYPSAECASATICGPIKKHFVDHFHKKPVPEYKLVPEYHPVPEHKPEPEYHPPMPDYHPPTPTYGGSPTPIYHPPALRASATFCGKIKKHFLDHFHKKPVPKYKPVPEYHPVPEHKPVPEYHPPTPEYHPPTPEYHPPTPVYGQPKPTPIYHPPVKH